MSVNLRNSTQPLPLATFREDYLFIIHSFIHLDMGSHVPQTSLEDNFAFLSVPIFLLLSPSAEITRLCHR